VGCLQTLLRLIPQLREVEEASAAAAAKAEELTAALGASEEALTEARELTTQQASRLSHLESEFEALQVGFVTLHAFPCSNPI
jgi:chromosome segregation ATPase